MNIYLYAESGNFVSGVNIEWCAVPPALHITYKARFFIDVVG
jgi:hypothetical protein